VELDREAVVVCITTTTKVIAWPCSERSRPPRETGKKVVQGVELDREAVVVICIHHIIMCTRDRIRIEKVLE
jgi:hypothetical protein